MADVLLPATSGRAKCKGCGRPISAGELRFGESLPNPYGEGDTYHWLHLICAACMRPEKFLPALEASSVEISERGWLTSTAQFGIGYPRLSRLSHAERSKSGKARCRSCREVIAGGVVRVALQIFEEGRMSPMGFIHVECSSNYFGTAHIAESIEKLSPDLDADALAEVSMRLANQRAPSPDAPTPGEPVVL